MEEPTSLPPERMSNEPGFASTRNHALHALQSIEATYPVFSQDDRMTSTNQKSQKTSTHEGLAPTSSSSPVSSLESHKPQEVISESSDVRRESDEERDTRLLKELKEKIKPLSRDEIQKKNQQFDERYHCEFEDIDENKKRVKIKLIMQKEPLVTSIESIYENVIDFRPGEIIGENNNNYQDLRHKGGKKRMNLSDLKYQSLRKAAERKGIAIPSSLDALVGGDIDEPGSKQEIGEIFARNPSGVIHKDNPDFTKLLLTKIGKDKLWIVGQYFPHQEIDYIKIIKGSRSNYIEEVRFPLTDVNAKNRAPD